MTVEVTVLLEGAREDVVVDGVKTSRAICSSVVLLKAGKDVVIVDPGAMGYGEAVVLRLRECGLAPKDVNIIVNTHMHLDHTYNNYLFPGAVIYTPTSVWYPDRGNRVEMFAGITDPHIPGIGFISTPGHTGKHISVVADSSEGRVVVAGDAVRASIIDGSDTADRYKDPRQYMESMRAVFSIADVIVPGHGPVIRGERLRTLKERLEKLTRR